MTEQQYTCPSCHKDYTRFTISEHYECGVEPLETVNPVDDEHSAMLGAKSISLEEAKLLYPGDPNAKATMITGNNTEIERLYIQNEEQKPAPKKRGPKPKAK